MRDFIALLGIFLKKLDHISDYSLDIDSFSNIINYDIINLYLIGGTYMKSRKGFSLIELMVVIAILGAITAIALPMYNKYRAKSFQTKAVTEMKEYIKAFRAAYAAGEPTFNITNQTYNVGTGQVYTTAPFSASDFNTTCRLRIRTGITLGEPTFNISVPTTPTGNGALCYDLFMQGQGANTLGNFRNKILNYQ